MKQNIRSIECNMLVTGDTLRASFEKGSEIHGSSKCGSEQQFLTEIPSAGSGEQELQSFSLALLVAASHLNDILWPPRTRL